MNTEEFHDIVGIDIWQRMDFIRKMGNNAAYRKKVTIEQAVLCLENLCIFLDFVVYCYGKNYTEGKFNPALLQQESEPVAAVPAGVPDINLEALIAENKALKEELTARREERQSYVPNRWSYRSTEHGRFILTLCSWMPAGPKAETG